MVLKEVKEDLNTFRSSVITMLRTHDGARLSFCYYVITRVLAFVEILESIRKVLLIDMSDTVALR